MMSSGLSIERSHCPASPQVEAKRDFEGFQPVRGRRVNVLEGLELHNGVLSPDEQVNMIDTIYNLVQQVAPASSSP